MVRRSALTSVLLASLLGSLSVASARPEAGAQERPHRRSADASSAKSWVSTVVTKITRAGEPAGAAYPAGMVMVRVRIGAGGAMEGATVEESSGSPVLDERALRAVRSASPFAPPPTSLLTLEGYTELSFPVDFRPPAHR